MNIINFLLPLIVVIPLFVSLFLIFIPNFTASWIITTITTFIVFLIVLLIIPIFETLPATYYFGNFIPPYGIEYKIDSLSLFFLFFVSFIALICTIWSKKSLSIELTSLRARFFNSVYLLAYSGFLGILLTNDLFNLFVFLEISSLSSYVLIALSKKKESVITAFNYLIIGTIAASFYMFGVGILYSIFGTLNIDDLITKFTSSAVSPLFIFGATLIITAIFIKMALFPTLWWLPKTYQNSISVVSAFFAGVSTKIAIYMFIKIVIVIFTKNNNFIIDNIFNLTIILAIISMFLAGFIALKQSSLKLLLAFSSISQIGFIMLGFALFKIDSISAAFYIMLCHAFIKVGLFLCVGNIYLKYKTDNLFSLKGIGATMPFTFFAIIFLCLSLASVPATSGFWGKLYLVIGAFRSQYWYLGFVVIIASVLSFYYSWKIINQLWRSKKSSTKKHVPAKTDKSYFLMNFAISLTIIMNILLTIFPQYVLGYIQYIISFIFI